MGKFVLKDNNSEKNLPSEVYTCKPNCQIGIASIL